MNTHLHLEETLQRDIEALREKAAEMARLGRNALKASLQALVERNRRLAYSVILRDQYIDELETELDRLCLGFLARQQPVAGHLRLVFATIQINRALERIGDYAESIARQALALEGLEPMPPWNTFIELADLSLRMLEEAMRSFTQGDGALAARTMGIEEQANSLRNRIKAELLDLNLQGQLPAAALGPLNTVARRLERTADQAKNICEDVLYMCTGEFAKHKGAEAFRILFVDAHGGLSRMAEGIGRSLGLPRFVFSSACLQPEPLDPRLGAFLAARGINLSGQAGRSLEQVPNWENSQVIISLGAEVRKALPEHPGKPVEFTWTIVDPTEAAGQSEKVPAALEATYRFLETNIRELAGAISEEPQPELKS